MNSAPAAMEEKPSVFRDSIIFVAGLLLLFVLEFGMWLISVLPE